MSHLDVTRSNDIGNGRLKKLAVAAKAFNHNDIRKHDSDVKQGAVAIVRSILHSCSMSFSGRSKEIQHCLQILLNLYRCSEERLCASFCTDGIIILDLLEIIEINYRLGKKGDIPTLVLAQHVVDKLSSVRVPLSMVNEQEQLLSSLIGNITGCTGHLVMTMSMKILAAISEHSKNKQAMFNFPKLMNAVALGATYMFESVREESARIIMNLSVEPKNKNELARSSLGLVLALTRGGQLSRVYAIQALGHMSSQIPMNKVIVVNYGNGVVVTVLLQVASSRTDTDLRVLATRILGNLTCQATAVQICHHPSLLVTLSSLACLEGEKLDKVASNSALIVKKIATYVRSSDTCHRHLLQAMVTISYGKSTAALVWTVKAFMEQAGFPEDRLSMIGHKGILSALTMLTNDENDFVRDHSLDALVKLAVDVSMARNVTVDKVLRSVASNSQQGGFGLQQNRNKRQSSPRYSPKSVAFDVDFASYL